ncbi:MAG: hypothetical protein GXO97_01675 [Nitrospirae bacterium]|nr:hypothetical protein [Nitrospirota bacterium]
MVKKQWCREIRSITPGRTDFCRGIIKKYIQRWLRVPFPSLIFKWPSGSAGVWMLVRKEINYPAPPVTLKKLYLSMGIDLFVSLPSTVSRGFAKPVPATAKAGSTVFHWEHQKNAWQSSTMKLFYLASFAAGHPVTGGWSASPLPRRFSGARRKAGHSPGQYSGVGLRQSYRAGKEDHVTMTGPGRSVSIYHLMAEKGYPGRSILSGVLRRTGLYLFPHYMGIAEPGQDTSGKDLQNTLRSVREEGFSFSWGALHPATNATMIKMIPGNSVFQLCDYHWKRTISRLFNMVSLDYTNLYRRDRHGDSSEINRFYTEGSTAFLFNKGSFKEERFNNLLLSENIAQRSYHSDEENMKLYFNNMHNFNEEIKELKKLILQTRGEMENVPSKEFIRRELERNAVRHFDIKEVTDRVYSELTRRIRLERERRGLYA